MWQNISYSIFGPNTLFVSLDERPFNLLFNDFFQFGANNSTDDNASASLKSSLLIYITSLQAEIVHSGCVLSINSMSIPEIICPSLRTLKYHPVLPLC